MHQYRKGNFPGHLEFAGQIARPHASSKSLATLWVYRYRIGNPLRALLNKQT